MKNGDNVVGEALDGIQFDGDATEAEIQNAGAAFALFAENGVGVGAGHGNALGSALYRVDTLARLHGSQRAFRRGGACGGRSSEIGPSLFRGTTGLNRNGLGGERLRFGRRRSFAGGLAATFGLKLSWLGHRS